MVEVRQWLSFAGKTPWLILIPESPKMPEQTAIATNQRRNLLLEAIRRLSKTRSWVTQRDLLADLKGQGYDVKKHHILRDLKALLIIYPELECHNESDEDGNPKRGVEFGYRWLAKDVTPETGLSIPEALSLILVSRHLTQALPATLSGALDKLFDRAKATLDLQQKNGTAHWENMVGIVTPAQPMLPPKVSDEVVQVIHQALIAREKFSGVYRNSKGEQEERLMNPLGLMVREPAIYLIAVVEGHQDPRMFAMHRFLSARREYIPSVQPDGFCLDSYLDEQGNFGTGKWLTLKAKVNTYLGMILEETPLGKNQKLSQPDKSGWRNLTVSVRNNWQLRWWLLGQGDKIVVQAPAELASKILSTALSVVTAYQAETNPNNR